MHSGVEAIDVLAPSLGHAPDEAAKASECVFVGSIKSDKYSYPSCSAAKRIKPENESLRRTILRLQYDPKAAELFSVRAVAPRTAPADREPFETAWAEYRAGKIYKHR
jgi:hypothetical protein